MTTRINPSLTLLAACVLLVPTAAQEPKQLSREFASVAGTVERVDRNSRLLTLRVDRDVTQTVYVPPDFKLFDELRAGDRVAARFRESVIVSARPGLKPQIPTDTTAEAKSRRGAADPEVLQQLTTVVTIEDIDRTAQLVTYKTADNRRIVRAVTDPHLLDGLKPHDVIEVTLTRERVVELQRR